MVNQIAVWYYDKSIPVYDIDGIAYALDGWDGEVFRNCFAVYGKRWDISGISTYIIKPNFSLSGKIIDLELLDN